MFRMERMKGREEEEAVVVEAMFGRSCEVADIVANWTFCVQRLYT